MQSLQRDGLTAEQVRELLVGQSVERSFGVDLLDTDGRLIDTLADDVRDWTVTYSNSDQVHGSLSVTLDRELAWATTRVRPWMSLSSGSVFTETEVVVPGDGVIATGGIVTDVGGYRIHTFTNGGELTVTSPGKVEYLIVAGGGGGSGGTAGGGGAGGLLTNLGSPLAVSAQAYPIVVGAGGAGSITTSAYGSPGEDSTAFGLTAVGGGRGGHSEGGSVAYPGGDGGSGGGGVDYAYNISAPGEGVAGQGHDGAVPPDGGGGGGSGGGGGGGGAGGAGDGPDGGPGVESLIAGTATYYAGGGGGGRGSSGQGSGGIGGGSDGASGAALDATPNTGGGGGGGYSYSKGIGGAGGSGIVVIRYLLPSDVTTTVRTPAVARFNMGVYVPEVPDDEHGGGIRQWKVLGRNLLALLDKQVGDAYVVTAGTTYLAALRALVADADATVPVQLGGDRQATTLTEDKVWWNVTYLDIANDLLAAIGYTDLYCTPEGAFQSLPLLGQGETEGVSWTFDSRPTSDAQNADLLAASWTERRALGGGVNRWTFVAQRWPTLPIDGDGRFRYVNQSEGPLSVEALGGEIRSDAVQVLDVADHAALVAEGWRIIAADLRSTHSATIQVDPLPIAGHRDTVRVIADDRDLRMQVSSWQVSTDGRGTWVLGDDTGDQTTERAEQQVVATVTTVSPLTIIIDGADTMCPAVVLEDDAGVTPTYDLGRRVRVTVRSPQVPIIQGIETTT